MKQSGSKKLQSFSLRSEMKRNRREKMPSFSLRSEMDAEIFRFDAKKVFFRLFSHLKWNENKIKRKQSEKPLFRFALKRNEKIGSETKKFWKRNKAKIRSINFALVKSEKIRNEKKRIKKICFTWACETDFVSLRFALKGNNFFLRNRRTLLWVSREITKGCQNFQTSSVHTSYKVSSSSFYNSAALYLPVPIIIIRRSALLTLGLYICLLAVKTTLVHIMHTQTSIRVYRAFPAIDEEKQWLTRTSALPSVLQ